MDRRTIIFGIVALIALVILLLLFFRDGEKNTPILFPTIIPGDIIQTQYPFEESTVETYKIEYAAGDKDTSSINLSKKIDFTVNWDNGFGFEDVTAMKLQHLVVKDSTTTEVSNLNLDTDTYAVDHGQNNSNVLRGSTRTVSILGTNKFTLLYSTDTGGTKSYKPLQTVAAATFSDIEITSDQLLVSLDLVDRATYIFTPGLKNIQPPSWTTSVEGKFITLYANSGTFLNALLDNASASQGIFFIRGTVANTFQMTIGEKTGVKKLIQVNSDGRVATVPMPSALSAASDVKIIEYDATAGEDKKFSIMLANTTKPDNLLVYQNDFKFADIKQIDDIDTFNSIYLRLSDSNADVGMYCKETVSCLKGGSASAGCGGVNIGRGQKCTAYSIGDPGKGYTLCSSAQTKSIPSQSPAGQFVSPCAVDAEYRKKTVFDTSCAPSNTCKLPGDPVNSVRSWEKSLNEKNGGNAGTLPAAVVTMCSYTGDCGECGYKTVPGKCATTDAELKAYGRAKYFTYPKFTTESKGTKCITPTATKGSAWIPTDAGTCSNDRALCQRVEASAPGTNAPQKCIDGKLNKWENVNNPHGRDVNDSNCGPAAWKQLNFNKNCMAEFKRTMVRGWDGVKITDVPSYSYTPADCAKIKGASDTLWNKAMCYEYKKTCNGITFYGQDQQCESKPVG